MKIQLLILLLVAVLLGSTTNANETTKNSRLSTDLNVKEPVDAIKTKLALFISAFNFDSVLVFIIELVIRCVLPGLSASSKLGNSTFEAKAVILELTAEVPAVPYVSFEDYCKTKDFAIIHKYFWENEKDLQMKDLVEWLNRFGYKDIYLNIHKLYEDSNCPADLIKTLPKGPDPPPNRVHKNHQPSNIRERYFQSQKEQPFAENSPNQCTIGDIFTLIGKLPDTGLLQLGDLIQTVVYQIRTSASLQFFMGKLQEPIKGKSFRGFHKLQPIKNILKDIHEQMINDKTWKLIFNFIKSQLGLDFFKHNIVDTLVYVMEYILWGTPFYAPSNPTSNSLPTIVGLERHF